jgi:xylulokinase
LGAARLAQLAMHPDIPVTELLPQLALEQTHQPDIAKNAAYAPRRDVFRRLYQQLKPLMS